jgi:hypothetical protein
MERWDELAAEAPPGVRRLLGFMKRDVNKHRLRHPQGFKACFEPLSASHLEATGQIRNILRYILPTNKIYRNLTGQLIAVSGDTYWSAFRLIYRKFGAGDLRLIPYTDLIEADGLDPQVLGVDVRKVYLEARPPYAMRDPCSGGRLVPVTAAVQQNGFALEHASISEPHIQRGLCWTCGRLTKAFIVSSCGLHVCCSNEACREQSAKECARVTASIASAVQALHKSPRWPFCTVTYKSVTDDRRIYIPAPIPSIILCHAPLLCTLFEQLTDKQAMDCANSLPRFARELLKAEVQRAVIFNRQPKRHHLDRACR